MAQSYVLWTQVFIHILHFVFNFFIFFCYFITDGQLRHINTGEPFVFNAREDLHRWNQKRYEALGEVNVLFDISQLTQHQVIGLVSRY